MISTIGIHEVRGYARLFSSIGLKPELIDDLRHARPTSARDSGGTGFAELDTDARPSASAILAGEEESKPAKTFRFYPKVYKAAIAAANGSAGYEEYSEKVRELELEQPISLRHILDLKSDREPIAARRIAGVGLHSYPIVIRSMSFGSQGEMAYRAYAEAAKRANIIAMNGEGGEIQDMYGKYPKWRGQQVASGRFGVTSEMLNSSYLVEIKIGQGAKPGEGGHLPAKKVTEKVAQARNASPGTDLISPSNNHDLYSIEDLAELIDELKTANPDVRVSVKVPVVPNIGTIGVGIAKAGADIITLSGFEGGTGAARSHALRHVGLPSDIGTRAVHLALMEAGIRNRVEIWADGGYRHGWDIVKLHCLGANRVGFGTLAMVSLGCTICRGCQLDTCHVGIATQIETKEEAELKGLKKFTPAGVRARRRRTARASSRAMGEEVRRDRRRARLRARAGPGRPLRPARAVARGASDVDVHEMIRPLEEMLDLEPIDLPGARGGARGGRPDRGAPDPDARPKEALGTSCAALGRRDVGAGTARSRRIGYVGERGPPTPTTACSAPSWPASSRGPASSSPDARPAPSEDTLADLTSTAARSAARASARSTSTASTSRVEGGAQDGVGKTMLGGKIAVMKGKNRFGKRVNGSVGKSFAYGAQRGRLFVQGDADSRFCIRLSGADVVIGGEPEGPLDDELGCIADRANIKGFAFEYMTDGRAVVLGDPGPWSCAGQTGGRVYMRVNEDWGLDREALERRLGKGAKVALEELDAEGVLDVQELLGHYAEELRAHRPARRGAPHPRRSPPSPSSTS